MYHLHFKSIILDKKNQLKKKYITYDSIYIKFKIDKTNFSDKQNSNYCGKIMTGVGVKEVSGGTRNVRFLGGNYTTMFTL